MSAVLGLFEEIDSGRHADTYGDGMDGAGVQDIARNFLFYYKREQFALLSDRLGVDADSLIREVERIAFNV